MENLPITREGLIKNFSKSSDSIYHSEISVYKGALVSNESVVNYSIKIRHAFPSLPPEFYDVLLEMIKEEGFTDERFRDAVHHVIKTCHYPTPTIADFISFDKRFKVLTYDELLKKGNELGPEAIKFYKPVKFPEKEKPAWVHVDDIKRYKLELYEPDK